MKSIWKIAVYGMAAMVLLAACKSNPTSNDPNEVLNSFFQHLATKDIDGASRYVTTGSKMTMQMMKMGMEMAGRLTDSLPQEDLIKEFENVTIAPARIEGDSAFIQVKRQNDPDQSAEFKLLKQDDGWKVDFSTATLMRMGMQGTESYKDAVLPDLDSEQIQKGMKMADSVLKNGGSELMKEIENKLKNIR